MSEIKVFTTSILVIGLVAIIIPLLITSMGLTPDTTEVEGIFAVAIDIVNFNIDVPFLGEINVFPQFLKDILTGWFLSWAIVPPVITTLVFTVLISGLTYAIIKLLPTT